MVLQLTATPPYTTLLHSLLNQAGMSVSEVKVASAVLEAVFRDTEAVESPTWAGVLDHISWRRGTRIQQLLVQAVSQGQVLLHAHIRHSQPG